jgi:hypothetical protein
MNGAGSMHPMIKPALRRAWRDRQTVQYGVAPAHAVLLGPVDNTTAAFMETMDGTRSLAQLREEAGRLGLSEQTPERLVERLAAAGVLDDATADREAAARVSEGHRPDLASLSVVHREPGAGLRTLAARREASVQVRGAGRVGAQVAAALAAAGVGEVAVLDGGRVQPWDTAPGGLRPEDQGERRDAAARRAVSRARVGNAPGVPPGVSPGAPPGVPPGLPPDVSPESPPGTSSRTSSASPSQQRAARTARRPAPVQRAGPGVRPGKRSTAGRRPRRVDEAPARTPDLVVLTPRDGLDAYAPDPGAAEGFIAAGTPHLYGGVVESTGFVGPLVTPGTTPCAGCILLGRAEHEPTWRMVVGQWRTSARRKSGVPACDMALAAVVAGAVASYALTFLDGDRSCAGGYRTRFALPRLLGSTEQFTPHPECPCGAAAWAADPPPSADGTSDGTAGGAVA